MTRILTREQLISSLRLNSSGSFLLGAGCSISSGCMASGELIQDFKKRLYCSNHGCSYEDLAKIDPTALEKTLQDEFVNDSDSPDYSYYFEKCFPLPGDRNDFIKKAFLDKNPSLGYLCFAHHLLSCRTRFVFTTNFDHLIRKAITKLSPNYDVVQTSENEKAIGQNDLTIVSLHGDFNYDLIKNTAHELETLGKNAFDAFKSGVGQRIYVFGYSGLDNSVMSAFERCLTDDPNLSIVWCAHESDVSNLPKRVLNLIQNSANGALALGIDFDDIFLSLYRTSSEKNDSIEKVFHRDDKRLFDWRESIKDIDDFNLNCYPSQRLPTLYRGQTVGDESSVFVSYKNEIYTLEPFQGSIEENFEDSLLPLSLKKHLVMAQIEAACISKKLNVFTEKIYFSSEARIKPALAFDIELFNRKVCLVLNPDYTTGANPTSSEIASINAKKSALYPKQSHQLLDELIYKMLGNDLDFSTGKIKLIFSRRPISKKDIPTRFSNRCSEPLMVTNGHESVNQLSLLFRDGPSNPLFSKDTISVGVCCLASKKHRLYNFLQQLKNGSDTDSSTDLIQRYPGFHSLFGKEIEFCGDKTIDYSENEIANLTPESFLNFTENWIRKVYESRHPDIVLFFFTDAMSKYRSSLDYDFHDALKNRLLNTYKTQILEESTFLSKDDINKVLFNLATALYTKTIGMPWQPKLYDKTKFFLGMSFGYTSDGIVVSCSQLFDGAGRGLKLLASPVEKKCRKNQYLSEKEAFELGKKIRNVYYQCSSPYELKKVVIHRSDPFKEEEINGFSMAFEGLDDFALYQIVEYPSINGYVIKNNKLWGYPMRRGTFIGESGSEILLWTDGSVLEEDVMGTKTYRASKRGMGHPILIRKFHGAESAETACNDIMYLTKMDFNSSEILYSRLPVSIKYSKILSQILKQKRKTSIPELIDFRYIM